MRVESWEIKLVEYLRSIKTKPFQWGEHDCFIFAGSVVQVLTGEDIYSEAIGKYHDADSARDFCRANGYASHVHYFSKQFVTRPSILSAMRGDIVVMRGLEGGAALGVCQGPLVYGIGETGLYTVPLTAARKVFAI